jgi:hypothetical protein
MRRADTIGFSRTSSGEGKLFSAAFIGAVIALTSVLYLIDVATVRALLSIP